MHCVPEYFLDTFKLTCPLSNVSKSFPPPSGHHFVPDDNVSYISVDAFNAPYSFHLDTYMDSSF